ncbi:MAG: chromate transporter [Chloroflexota bacterium]|nr:chromate transporter [Chloroflexota bacterium]MDE3193900.1 chromate transporter [Chloroflexota bacterium]
MPDPIEIALVFSRLGLLTFGGGLTVLAEMERVVVKEHGWVTDAAYWQSFALGQITPGPGIFMVIPLGWRIGGPTAALVATIAFLLPPTIIGLTAVSLWQRVRELAWPRAIARALAPVALGLVAAGFVSIARVALTDVVSAVALVIAVALLVRLNAVTVVALAGAAGALATMLR